MIDTSLRATAERIIRTKDEGFSPAYDDEHGNTQMTWYDQDAERLAKWLLALTTDSASVSMQLFGGILMTFADTLGDKLLDHDVTNQLMPLASKMEALWNSLPDVPSEVTA